ncbi:unnamed protein product [Durusdinium trenchii]|uniref:Poly [ADP-ribose] polymerase n=1 Tax=Durusdinium trenchii TaxID=1381693 RepID=A0ABP0JHI5_9DINO
MFSSPMYCSVAVLASNVQCIVFRRVDELFESRIFRKESKEQEWRMERESLQSQIDDLTQKAAMSEKSKDAEIERLKSAAATSEKNKDAEIKRLKIAAAMSDAEIKGLKAKLESEKQNCWWKMSSQQNSRSAEIEQMMNEMCSMVRRLHLPPQVDGETWQYQTNSGEWAEFQDKANKELMLKFQEGQQTCEMTIDGIAYDYDFQVMNQTNKRTKKARSIRFCSNLPHHWGITDADSLKMLLPVNQGNGQDGSDDRICFVTDPAVMSTLEDLLNGSKRRHDGTGCDCLHGRSTFRLVEAYQVKNRELWRRYQRHVRSILDKHKQHGIKPRVIDPPVGEALTRFATDIQVDLVGNELLLFHGTREFDLAKTIAKEGFDNRIARSGGLYGSGTYFAAQTCKSAQYATNKGMQEKASTQLMGTMLVARVAIGDPHYASGPCKNLTRPPTKNVSASASNSAHEIRYDSIIAKPGIPNGQSNGVQAHMEFVTFAPEQAYPEYILRFIEE